MSLFLYIMYRLSGNYCCTVTENKRN